MKLLIPIIALAASTMVSAQVQPVSAGGDSRLQIVNYDPNQIVVLRGAPGYQLMVEFSPNERVQTAAVGDPGVWQVSVNRAGDRLFIRPSQSNAPSNMTVVTTVRTYAFELVPQPGPSSDVPWTVQFRYPALSSEDAGGYLNPSAALRKLSRYRISGDQLLRPASVTDDRQRTYISWAAGSPIPAIYGLGSDGREMLVNGMMGTDDVFVIDGVASELRFRIDRRLARARRVVRKAER